MLRDAPKNQGGDPVPHRNRVDEPPTLADIGIDKKTSMVAQQLAALPREHFPSRRMLAVVNGGHTMEFDPDSPTNVASAHTAQAVAGAQARAVEGDTLPLPRAVRLTCGSAGRCGAAGGCSGLAHGLALPVGWQRRIGRHSSPLQRFAFDLLKRRRPAQRKPLSESHRSSEGLARSERQIRGFVARGRFGVPWLDGSAPSSTNRKRRQGLGPSARGQVSAQVGVPTANPTLADIGIDQNRGHAPPLGLGVIRPLYSVPRSPAYDMASRRANVFETIMYEYALLIADQAIEARSSLAPADRTSKSYWQFVWLTFKKLSDGRISSSTILRENKLLVAGGQYCAYCDGTDSLQWEHIIPKSRGGPDSIDNLVLSCAKCNREKGARNPLEWYFDRSLHRKNIPRLVMGKLLKLVLEEHRKRDTLLIGEFPQGAGLYLHNVCLVFEQKPEFPTEEHNDA